MSRYYQGCMNAKKFRKIDSNKFEKSFKMDTIVKLTRSAPAMEVVGNTKIFERSIEINKLRYTEFYGDGGSITKKECIGYVQKRVGNNLRNLKKKVKGLGGKGKLTDTEIDKL